MSKYLLNKFLYTVDRDPELVERYRTDPAATVEWWEAEMAGRLLNCIDAEQTTWLSFTEDERGALRRHDHVALFEMGAHPFLTLTLFIAMFERDHGPLGGAAAAGQPASSAAHRASGAGGMRRGAVRPAGAAAADGRPAGPIAGADMLFARGLAQTTVLLWLMAFCGLLLTFALGTWLPTIMKRASSPGSARVPAWGVPADGSVLAASWRASSWPADGLLVISRGPAMWLLSLSLLVRRLGLLGVQAFVDAFVVERMPAELRTSATDRALSVGRLGGIVSPSLGGRILDSGLDLKGNFYVFAAIGAVGALAAICVPRRGSRRPETWAQAPPVVALRPDSAT
ncbi:hypothetical protein [Streptomyces sp. A012304]|uniref:hypothetical protein n=1 Tax=Streptomyces sp. A012304 TaxID=375446 RepID=UPI00223035CA|nr:hypothetical protein [Streptomyces sp. A012304]GKQ39961.1 hypothetical protein ALMP_64870 [Streptomyces sp. A012304]